MRFLVTVLFGCATLAHASDLLVNLDNSMLSGTPGQTITFTGTLHNNDAFMLFINSDSFTFAINGALDDTPFFDNAPLTLGALATSPDFAMFNINIPLSQAPGPYDGVFTVLGGPDSSSDADVLGSASFTVNVSSPEPGSMLLCGAAGALLLCRRRRPRSS